MNIIFSLQTRTQISLLTRGDSTHIIEEMIEERGKTN